MKREGHTQDNCSDSCGNVCSEPLKCTFQCEKFLFVAVEQLRGANIGTSLRCAVAFGADAFVLVGSSKFSTHGAHGEGERERGREREREALASISC